VLQMW